MIKQHGARFTLNHWFISEKPGHPEKSGQKENNQQFVRVHLIPFKAWFGYDILAGDMAEAGPAHP